VSLCADSPRHTSVKDVFAKVALINRGYRANLELGARDAEWKVAERFVKGRVDEIMAPLHKLSVFSAASLPVILDVHEQLARLASKVTARVENSFVSKYLHFHFVDLVPIFDRYAYERSWKLAPLPKADWPLYSRRKNYDYACHCASVLTVMNKLEEGGVKSPKLAIIDVLLYGDRADP